MSFHGTMQLVLHFKKIWKIVPHFAGFFSQLNINSQILITQSAHLSHAM